MHKAKIAVAVLFAAVSSGLAAEVPDLTDSMEAMCNPNATRWTTSQMFSRAVTSIGVHDGLLFVSGGDWSDNTGPCPIFAVNPYTGSYRNEWDAGTECVNYYREGSDGCVYIPSIDPKNGHANCCDVSRRNPNGTWTKLNIAPNVWLYWSSKENAAYGTHTWDVAIWKGKIFTAGYGIGVGPEKTTSRLSDATPGLPDAYRRYASSFGGTFQRPRRFEAFLPFDDELFAIPLNYASIQSANFKVWDFEEWRFNESTSKFVCQTNTAANIVPGLKATDFGLFGSRTDLDIQLWSPTKFKGRVLYIPGNEHGTTKPVAALYSATNENHHVKATRVEFGSGVYPFDIFARDDVVLVVTAQYDSAKSNVVNSVWESTDGVSFVKKFFFSAPQHASAMAYLDGSYYFAMGTRTTVSTAWTLKGSDVAGQIYRIRDPDCASAIEIVAENATVSVPEGGTAAARFKLAAQPSTSVTAGVRIVYAGVPAVTTTVASVTFTPQDWNVWHEVPVAAAEDDLDTVRSATLFFGVGAPATLRATSITVTPVNNDVRVADTPPEGLVDITVPNGGFSVSSSVSPAVSNPFNDDPSGTNTANRLLVKSASVKVDYDFGNPAIVNGYGIYNFVPSGYSPAERAPHTWTFQASNDGRNWTTLDERHLESGWTGGEYRYYAVSNETAYTLYRLAITANNGNEYTQFARMEMYGTGKSLIPLTTATSGEIYTNSTSHATYGAKGAFDHNRSDTNGRWLASKADHMYVVYKFNEATAANMLRVWNGSNSGGGASSAERSPKAWTFEASNDGENWTTLDTRSNEPDWSASGEQRDYTFTNDTAYLYYKFDCTELCSASATYLQLWELEFYYIEDGSGTGGDPGDEPGEDPDPEPLVSDFAKKTTFTPSSTALAKIGATVWTNFPVLVRLPASVSSQLRTAAGTDLLVKDEGGAELPFEVETFNPAGTTFVWVSVPALSSSTKLTVMFSGAANTNNDPTAVWSRYAGVWHFAPSAAGTMTVPDATGHGLAGSTTNTLAAYEGPAGLGALKAATVVRTPDYDTNLVSAAKFSASGWFKAPEQVNSWMSVASKKVGITTGANGQNLWNIDKGWYLQLPQAKDKLDLIYTSSAQMTVPDVTTNWNYFQVVSDGSTLKVYLNGSTSPAKSVNYTVKASGTQYQICPKNGCSREYRIRNGAASAAETALEYATMADESFFTMGEVETVGVFVPAPVFGGEGVSAPAFGVDQASGNKVFTFTIGNAVKGAKYRIYKTESLSEPFVPFGDVIEATADGLLGFAVPTADKPSCFFKVVVE